MTGLRQIQTCSQYVRLSVTTEDSLCNSVFTRTESLLFGDNKYLEAFMFVTRRKNVEKYRSVIDFLCIETLRRIHIDGKFWYGECMKFYENTNRACKAHNMKNSPYYTEELRFGIDVFLAEIVLPICLMAYKDKSRRISWTQVGYSINEQYLLMKGVV